jgi:hypothetical protein
MQWCEGDEYGRTVGGDEEALFKFGEALGTDLVGLCESSQVSLTAFVEKNCQKATYSGLVCVHWCLVSTLAHG